MAGTLVGFHNVARAITDRGVSRGAGVFVATESPNVAHAPVTEPMSSVRRLSRVWFFMGFSDATTRPPRKPKFELKSDKLPGRTSCIFGDHA
jgi:hypothetical protein